MNFGEVLSRAWQIIWRNKILWVFGLLASLAAVGDTGNFQELNSRSGNIFHWTHQAGESFPLWAGLILAAGAVVLFFLVIVLGTLGRAALMRGAALADGGAPRLTFAQLFEAGRQYFARVLVLEILLVVAGLALVMVLVTPTVLTFGLGLLCLWPLFLLLGPLFFGLSVLFKLAIAAVTGEDLGTADALRRGWQVLRSNLAQVIAISLILLLGSYLVGSLIAMPVKAALAPVVIAAFSRADGFVRGGAVLSIFLFILYLPLLLAAGGMLMAYVDTAWAVIFRRLTGKTAQ